MPDIEKYDQFIDGEFAPSESDDRAEVTFPYNGDTWATVPLGTPDDVDRAVTAARDAFERDNWAGLQPSDRAALIRDVAAVIDDHANELAELETRQNGKLIREMSGQMNSLGDWFRYYASECETRDGDTIPVESKDGEMFNYVVEEPYGVVGAITPWNSPLLLTAFKLAPALAAGCTFVHKPSTQTPVSALRLAELLSDEAGLPDGVYNVITGSGSTVGDALIDHEDIDKVSFTGSTSVGRHIGKTAGENLIPASLELGGKSPNIVFDDANLDNAINGVIKGIFAATGQTCLAGSRVFLHEDITDEFIDRFTDRASDITLGDPRDPETEMGPVAFREQWETDRDYIRTALEEGATLQFGGEQPDDLPGQCFLEPTILTDVENNMTVAQEEIFGPIASVLTFSDEDDLIERANDTDFGLAAGIWTENFRKAHRIADAIEAGTIWINEYRTLTYNSPFGGYKDSGLGRENGHEGLEEYLQTKSVWVDLAGEVKDPFKLG
ncbi:aldehyde dehydrogenase [Halorubrum sp. GN11_10-6_MGM]|uniref:aldehyde dehydrogenase n=1 Tax=Halorubrum sp. GN11_10-6_MGM TaxID=2518112 RepID=UPI0010F9C6D9|nr:aldehyde dehydrogenase [Halorubrum sp. GN11_10-6_MGM]TKX73076.1 aldehyde dehydrogenase [Halorubrum sp. GN11_10-6_MGM]